VTVDGTEDYNMSVGNIEYTLSDDAVAYEAGGVWRRDTLTESSFAVSSPDFDFDGETLTLPVYNVTTQESYTGTRSVSVRADEPETVFNGTAEEVVINVTSDYYDGWARYFEDELRADAGEVDVNESADKVTVRYQSLETPELSRMGGREQEGVRPSG